MDLKQSNENAGAGDVPKSCVTASNDNCAKWSDKDPMDGRVSIEAIRNAEGLRVKYMLTGYILGRVSNDIVDFLRRADVTTFQWEAFMDHIVTPFMLTSDEQNAISEYYQPRSRVRHEFKPISKRHVRYYGMDLVIPESHSYVWLDKDRYVYSSDAPMKRDNRGHLKKWDGTAYGLLCHGYVEGPWDWFVFEQHSYSGSILEGSPFIPQEP